MFKTFRNFAPALFALLLPAFAGSAAEDHSAELKLFEQKVRPILLANCVKCHGDEKQKGQLRLDTRESALKGGESGPAVVPGDPSKSLLIAAINHIDKDLTMPPKEDKLPDAVRAGLEEWVRAGAVWPDGVKLTLGKVSRKKILTNEDKLFWSFQPVKNPPVPVLEDKKLAGEIDRFIAEKLKPLGLSLAPEADRRTLIRRATLDLHGLPPTPEEVEAFIDDRSPDAYEKLIDRLLASTRYGERYARHWLDLVRYAESDGFKQDSFRPSAWHYRDYVVASFNKDKSYDRFISEQLAGDELDPADPDVLAGTAFLRLSCYEYNNRDVPRGWSEYLNDLTDVCGDVFLGTSIACARCHDHKFDPILQADYYRFQAFFSGLRWTDNAPLATPAERAAHAEKLARWEQKTSTVRAQIEKIEKPHADNVTKKAIAKFAPEFQTILNKPAVQRSPLETQIAELAWRQVEDELKTLDGKISAGEREKWAALKRELSTFDPEKPAALPATNLATDLGPKAAPVYLGGDPKREELAPGFLSVLDPKPAEIAPPKESNSTGRRSALARWIASPANPLTARVMVNRLWQYHFGRGLVGTSSDFGHLGEKPSHPELLDWLAARFVQDGWSFKKLNRLILLSAAYRQSSTVAMPEQARLKDPENRLLWRMDARRLDAQEIRDSMLEVSGELDHKAGGASSDLSSHSRGIYTKVLRNTHDPLLEAYDEPDGLLSVAGRAMTTTATQALFLINGQWPLQRAEAFAARLAKMKNYDDEALVANAFSIAYGRPPAEKERLAALEFLRHARGAKPAAEETEPLKGASRNQYYQSQPMPQRGGQAAFFRADHSEDQLKLTGSDKLPNAEFTIEAVVLLESLYDNTSMRVIASRWDNNPAHPGWSLGITGEKSRHQPRNLVLQLCPADGKKTVEVVVSDLKLELHSPHYIAAVVKLAEPGESGVIFYMRDLSDPDAPLRSAAVKHTVTGTLIPTSALVIGGRDTANSSGWHGLIDDVRLSSAVLSKDQLLVNEGENKKVATGFWRFEETPGFFKDSDGLQPDLFPAGGKVVSETVQAHSSAVAEKKSPAISKGLVDFCHALLNSSEFIYSE